MVCSAAPLALRRAGPSDRELLFALMKSALGPHVVQTFGPWDEAAQRESFFARLEHTLGEHEVVELEGEAIGCLHVVRSREGFRLNRIFLLPSCQNAGLGTLLLRSLLCEADAARVPIRLRVLRVNPARRLYERLGFVTKEETETHFVMERGAPPP
jgi:GNAT superfamily N-acetyltransferase